MSTEITPTPPPPPTPAPIPPSLPRQTPSQPQAGKLDLQPLTAPASFATVIEALLKQPGRILYECRHGGRKVPAILLIGAVLGLLVFGVLLGTFSGGTQYWAAPAKVVAGVIVSLVICLPSLYIFSALGGMEAKLSQVMGMLLAMIALTALLLLGFAPVVWIFSQSTESVSFMGFLVLAFWVIALCFGFRLLKAAATSFGMVLGHYLNIWMAIFLVVTLQMSTSLRPLIGTSETLLPAKKKFFLQHWLEEMGEKNSSPGRDRYGR